MDKDYNYNMEKERTQGIWKRGRKGRGRKNSLEERERFQEKRVSL